MERYINKSIFVDGVYLHITRGALGICFNVYNFPPKNSEIVDGEEFFKKAFIFVNTKISYFSTYEDGSLCLICRRNINKVSDIRSKILGEVYDGEFKRNKKYPQFNGF